MHSGKLRTRSTSANGLQVMASYCVSSGNTVCSSNGGCGKEVDAVFVLFVVFIQCRLLVELWQDDGSSTRLKTRHLDYRETFE